MFEVFITPTNVKLLIFIRFQVIWPKMSLHDLYLVLTFQNFVISIKTTINDLKLSIYIMSEVFVTQTNLKLLIFIHFKVIWPKMS